MSSLTRFIPLTSRLATPVRTAAPAFGVAASRSLSSTTRKEKSAADATKDTLKKVDRTISDAALKGIETGEHARDKIKETVGSSSKEAGAKSEEVKDQAAKHAVQGKDKAEETYSEAKDKAEGTYSEAKAKAGGTAREAETKSEELKGEAAKRAEQGKGKAKEAYNEAKDSIR